MTRLPSPVKTYQLDSLDVSVLRWLDNTRDWGVGAGGATTSGRVHRVTGQPAVPTPPWASPGRPPSHHLQTLCDQEGPHILQDRGRWRWRCGTLLPRTPPFQVHYFIFTYSYNPCVEPTIWRNRWWHDERLWCVCWRPWERVKGG